jgi:hypothetical protein
MSSYYAPLYSKQIALYCHVCNRVFVIWNPPLKFGVEIGQMKDETEPTPGDEVAKQSSSAPAPATAATATAAQLIKLNGPSPAVVQAHTVTITETQTATNTAANTATEAVRAVVPSGKREGVRLTFSEEESSAEEEDPFSLFLEGCEDRPQTLSSDCVGYHRGWQRSRNAKNRKQQQGQRAPTIVRVPLALAPVDAVKTDKKPHSNLEQARMPRFRLSSITEMSQLLSFMVRLRVRTLAFCGVRKLVELVLKYCLSDLKSSSESEHLAECVASYRG